MSAYIQIKNWDQFQHYKDRAPPWIKLHRELLTSETWVSSSNDDRVLAIAIMMLASATGNKIPAKPAYIKRVAYLDDEPDFTHLISVGFIEIIEENDAVLADASKMQADARPEERRGEERRKDDASASADQIFWTNAKSFVGGKNPGAIIGKWCKEHGKDATAAAITAAQIERAVDPIPYITAVLRKGRAKAESSVPIC